MNKFLTGVIVLLILASSYLWWENYNLKKDGLSNRCLNYVKYDPEVKAWYWQDDYFPTKGEALESCVNFFSDSE